MGRETKLLALRDQHCRQLTVGFSLHYSTANFCQQQESKLRQFQPVLDDAAVWDVLCASLSARTCLIAPILVTNKSNSVLWFLGSFLSNQLKCKLAKSKSTKSFQGQAGFPRAIKMFKPLNVSDLFSCIPRLQPCTIKLRRNHSLTVILPKRAHSQAL